MNGATAIWVIGETLMLCAGGFALFTIYRDVRAAWPRIVELLRNRRDDT